MSATPAITIAVLRDPSGHVSACRACRRAIEWVTTVKGRKMPVDHPLTALRVTERTDGTFVTHIDAAQSHFVTCPDADAFRRPRQKGSPR